MTQQEAETVEASTLQVGDEVWIPNSRRAQAIDSITTEGEYMTLVVGDATWQLRPTAPVRRVKAED